MSVLTLTLTIYPLHRPPAQKKHETQQHKAPHNTKQQLVSILYYLMSAEEVAKAFVQHFYTTFDSNVQGLGGLYVSFNSDIYSQKSFSQSETETILIIVPNHTIPFLTLTLLRPSLLSSKNKVT